MPSHFEGPHPGRHRLGGQQHTADGSNQDSIPLVIMTRDTTEHNADNAVFEIEKLPCVVAGTERLRILD